MTVRPFPWQQAMGFAFAVLRLSPQAFWAMTPRELAAALRHGSSAAPALHHDDLATLMAAFPDTPAR